MMKWESSAKVGFNWDRVGCVCFFGSCGWVLRWESWECDWEIMFFWEKMWKILRACGW